MVETPSNPLLKITDIAAMADLARQRRNHLRLRQYLGQPGSTKVP